ncbi:MAG TPA: hypothetical protein VI248_15225 [Kineosporiaceae bacterium]
MSPVSRGRGKKNRSSKGPRGGRTPARRIPPSAGHDLHSWPLPGNSSGRDNRTAPRHPQRTALDTIADIAAMLPGAEQAKAESRSWWPDSHTEILAAATALLSCASPTALEDAVCDLLGRHWQQLYEVHDTGLRADEWLEGLLDVAKPRAGEPAVRRLLFGIAVIATPGLAGLAVDLLRHTSAAPDDEEPAWLTDVPTVTASPELLLLRDAYGLRFAVLTQVTGPGGQPRTYLYDIDLCHGFYQVLNSGYHPDTTTAAAAWRDLVGASATDAEPRPAPDQLLPHVLPGGGLIDGLFGQPLTASHFTELYRGDRIVFAISAALEAAGRPITWPHGDPQQAADLATILTERFKAWADGNDVALPPSDGPDDDVVTWMLHDWVSPGMTEELALACSPHRIAAFTAYLNDDWRDEHRPRALQVLLPWVRFCLEHNPLGRQAETELLAWAERAAREPAEVGADLGNNLNRPIDETTLTGPALPTHARPH